MTKFDRAPWCLIRFSLDRASPSLKGDLDIVRDEMEIRQTRSMISRPATTEQFTLDTMFFFGQMTVASQSRLVAFLRMIGSQFSF
ncbi:MAG TPA: hypothetical protein VIB79_24645, partial [Candidatus Binatia bacterium]